jgi:hypothetical protein
MCRLSLARNGCWRGAIESKKAGSIVTALRNRYKTGSFEKLVFILSNLEQGDVIKRIKQKRDQRKKRFKEAPSAMRTGSSAAFLLLQIYP